MDSIKVKRNCANCKHWRREEKWVRTRSVIKTVPAPGIFGWLGIKRYDWDDVPVGDAAMCALNPEWVEKLGTSFCGHYEQFCS